MTNNKNNDKKIADVACDSEKKWFYSDVVKEHFFKPKNIFKNEAEMKKYKADGIGIVGSPACVTGNSLLQLNPSLKNINEAKIKDKVLSDDGNYNEILKVHETFYDQEILKLKNQFGEVVISPEHLVYALKIPKGSSFAHNSYKRKVPASWYHAKDLEKGDICLYPIPKKSIDQGYMEIPQIKLKWDFKSKSLPKKIKIDKGLLRLFGYFVSEGNTKGSEICFSFHMDEMQYANDIKKTAKEIFDLDTNVIKNEDRKLMRVLLYNVHLARYLKETFGERCYVKKIPAFIMNLSPELQKSFIEGLWNGDGYIDFKAEKPRAEFSTSSRMLSQQLKLLLLRQGIEHSIYYEKAKTVNEVNHKECYRIHIGDYEALKKIAEILNVKFNYLKRTRIAKHSWFDDNYFYMPVRDVVQLNFKGNLYNLEVAHAHTFTTEAFTLHNCGDVMKMWIKVDAKKDVIKDCKWQCFGCGSAIATTSVLSEMVTEKGGMKLEEALKIRPMDIVKRLGGLPPKKIHCSVLGDQSLRAAIYDYFKKSGQEIRLPKRDPLMEEEGH